MTTGYIRGDRLDFIPTPFEHDISHNQVKALWYSIQDAQHSGRVKFPPWTPPALRDGPSQRLPAAPTAQPIDPAATKKDFLYYWYRPTGDFHNCVNISYARWPGPAPYERAHLASISQKAKVSQLPEHVWSGFPRPDPGPVAELVAKRLRDDENQLQHRRMWALEHRAQCQQRMANRQGERRAIEGLAGGAAAWGRSATASNSSLAVMPPFRGTGR
ncbi:hypothetical protein T492DRAFT_1062459 [Pavlovales sp. CCMP2436]|nr:hypothetical protein T492DRAFT_1062459 [Pavlovales sp. CCMP2436]|mmetsp:Transcript_38280/g.94811  ORF Transcript_38280/g.94811 Transcript_38280/m.94811 type:complete len:216 (-) Transcript_38280:165-812(-)